ELPDSRYSNTERTAAFFDHLVERAQALPGVQYASVTSHLPLGGGPNGVIQIEGQPKLPGFGGPLVQPTSITPDYFHVMEIPLLKGRAFNQADRAEATKVVIINQTLARNFSPNEDPLANLLR